MLFLKDGQIAAQFKNSRYRGVKKQMRASNLFKGCGRDATWTFTGNNIVLKTENLWEKCSNHDTQKNAQKDKVWSISTWVLFL